MHQISLDSDLFVLARVYLFIQKGHFPTILEGYDPKICPEASPPDPHRHLLSFIFELLAPPLRDGWLHH